MPLRTYRSGYRNYLWCEGDSYMDGAFGVNLWRIIKAASPLRGITNTAVGGSTITNVVDRIIEHQSLSEQDRLIVWDGSANGFTTVQAYLEEIDRALASLTSQCIWLPPVNVGPSSSPVPTAYTIQLEEIAAALVARGIATFDPVTLINTLSNGSPGDLQDIQARVIIRSVLLDTVHLNDAAQTLVGNEISVILVDDNL